MKKLALSSWALIILGIILVWADKPRAAAPLWMTGVASQFFIGTFYIAGKFFKRTR